LPCSRSYFVCVSFSIFFSILIIFQNHTLCISIFHIFQYFSKISRPYSVSVFFSTFFSFLAIIMVLQCGFLVFHVFQCSCHIPGPTVFMPHFPHCSVFSPLSMSYSQRFSFSKFFSFPTIFLIPQWAFLIFQFFQYFLPYSRSYSVHNSFFTFIRFFSPYSRLYSVQF